MADWTDCEIIVIPPAPRACCPECGHDRHIIIRSMTSADGSVTRRAVCRHCSSKFIVLVDPDLLASGWQD